MPNAEEATQKTPAKQGVFRTLLDYIKAMRTSPCIAADEAREWLNLEEEFTKRHEDAARDAA